ncbi:MAG: [FeFe] hydrogenase H-cluster radical SAM maturase HydG [Spirochaetales bacterium]|nr:[FeFe] hydrogenase H-cluster radical SAM maturase HydG [Spirochaetales bacterium]MCF7937534.1 [FeFe] hydrogenase H-cluster radical SAM maturase HydG [Spirochaetales bacterium]
MDSVIRRDEVDRYLQNGKDFIDEDEISCHLNNSRNPEKQQIRQIIQKSLAVERLEPEEAAALLQVEDPELWEEMYAAAGEVKRRVYDNRIVTFAPLYCSNYCVNNCSYCGFRKDNKTEKRRRLNPEEVRKETEVLAGLGHKRLIVVYGEHPLSDVDYIEESIRAVYDVEVPTRRGTGSIRRVNVNAAPLSIDKLRRLHEVGIGTFQVFQETYHKPTYARVHPSGIKADYRWRLYALHRAMEAGVDDVGAGALFGLYDWKFEVMGLLYHAMDLERCFGGIGPHTISFPRLNPASGAELSQHVPYPVDDQTLKKIVTVLRLSVPYTGLILTAREPAKLRRELIPVGVTQTDASTRIGIGAYNGEGNQEIDRQQFLLGDTRSLSEVIREFADMGLITSFCTAGYRCGRTGEKIMNLLKTGREGKFCKLNAVLTFREWLDDFADEETRTAGERVIGKEILEIENDPHFHDGNLLPLFRDYYNRLASGERDLYV